MDILIVGCGIAGPVLASFLLLSNRKVHVTILERSSIVRTAGQNVDIRGAGVAIIRKLGLEDAIRAATTGEIGAAWVDENDKVYGRFAADTSGRVQTGTSDIEILRGRLAELLYNRSKEISEEVKRRGGHGIEYIFGDSVEHIEQSEKVLVRFKSGKQRTFDLVVGADGLQSTVRKQVFGDHKSPLGMYGGFFSMPSGPTDSQWRRWYHAPKSRGIMIRPSHDKNISTVFMAFLSEHEVQAASIDKQKDLMASVFKDAGWEAERVIREMYASNDFYFDEVAQVKMDKWSKGKVVLLADAGYCASPISGMGTTLALTGAYNLAGVLTMHNDLTAALEAYETTMRPTVERAQKLAPGMPQVFHPETEVGLWIMTTLIWLISVTNVGLLLSMLKGPPANSVPITDYGFMDWKDMHVQAL